jgi:hypothetical protein
MTVSINNAIPFVPENTIDPAAGLNEAIIAIDGLVQLAVLSVNTNAPPAVPAEGDRHVVGTAPTGLWAGQAGKVARFLDGHWSFFGARVALNLADGILYGRTAGGWGRVAGAPTWGAIGGLLADQTDLVQALGLKVDKVNGYGLSANDFTGALLSKLNAIAAGATANQSDSFLLARGNHTGTQAIGTVAGLQNALDAKVATVAGKQLSDENYTALEKAKLAGLDPNHFRGMFATLAALQSAVPTANIGDYAFVDPSTGTDVIQYLWDNNDSKWVYNGPTAGVTAAQVKTLYESNPNTNAYTDAEKTKLGGVAANATANPDTDSLPEGTSNQYFLQSRVRQTPMTGLAAINSPILGTDTPVTGLGKAQGQIDAKLNTNFPAATGNLSVAGSTTIGAGLTLGGSIVAQANNGISLNMRSYIDNFGVTEVILGKGRGTIAAPMPLIATDRLGQFVFAGVRAAGQALTNAASLSVYAASDHTDTNQATYMNFENTVTGSVSRGIAATINEANNLLVGLGRGAATGSKVDVGGNLAATGNLIAGSASPLNVIGGLGGNLRHVKAGAGGQIDIDDVPVNATDSALIRLHRNITTAGSVQVAINRGNNTTQTDHLFNCAGTNAASTSYALLASGGGKVGIGQSAVDASATLAVAGDTRVTRNGQALATILSVDADAGQSATLRLATGTSRRWDLLKSADAEAGSNAGSDFQLVRYSDTNSYLSVPLAVSRATGLTTIAQLALSGGLTVTAAIRPGQFTIATRPSATANPGGEIDVTDTPGGPQRQRSNGTAWIVLNAGAWIDMVLTAGFTAGPTKPQYRVIDDCVEFRGKVTIDAALGMNTLRQLTAMPAGYRPSYLASTDTLLLGLFSPTATTPYLSALSTGVFSVGAKGGFAASEVIDLTNVRYSLA